MKRVKLIFLSILLAAVGSSAWAAHFHHGGGVRVYVGPPVGWGWYYPPPYYYPYAYPPVVVAPVEPQTYIEQAPPAESAPAPSSYWYYCSNPEGYYPYVKQCPGGWQKVAPRPPSQP